jgi:hypothetical protein
MKDKDQLFIELFEMSEHVRYIAVYDDDDLFMKQRDDIKNVSSNESDKYEELLVNPTLVKLATQRGNIDCGGLEYIIIRYGNFFVLLTPCKSGHVNIGIEPDQNPFLFVEPLNEILRKYNMKHEASSDFQRR